jgi:hypothetical protein
MQSLQFHSIKTMMETLTNTELNNLKKVIADIIQKRYVHSLYYRLWAHIKKTFPDYELHINYFNAKHFIIELTKNQVLSKFEFSKDMFYQYDTGSDMWKDKHVVNYMKIVDCCKTFRDTNTIWNEKDALNYVNN